MNGYSLMKYHPFGALMTMTNMLVIPGPTHMELADGQYLDLAYPSPSVITLENVARGLALRCRFGQCSRFYSVAEHSILVAMRLMKTGASMDVVLAGLHHDDAEAFVNDNARPLKALVPDLVAVERRVMAAVIEALDLTGLPFDDPLVKEADDWALACEAYHLMPSKGRGWFCDGLYVPEGDRYLGLTAVVAERHWLTMVSELGERHD